MTIPSVPGSPGSQFQYSILKHPAQIGKWLMGFEWSRETRGGMRHPLLHGRNLNRGYECFDDQETAEEFMQTIAADLESFFPLHRPKRCDDGVARFFDEEGTKVGARLFDNPAASIYARSMDWSTFLNYLERFQTLEGEK